MNVKRTEKRSRSLDALIVVKHYGFHILSIRNTRVVETMKSLKAKVKRSSVVKSLIGVYVLKGRVAFHIGFKTFTVQYRKPKISKGNLVRIRAEHEDSDREGIYYRVERVQYRRGVAEAVLLSRPKHPAAKHFWILFSRVKKV